MERMESRVRNAEAADLAVIRDAVRAAGLPVDGVDSNLDGLFICESAGVFRGAAGLEIHGDDGLLRSVVVEPKSQRLGVGRRLCEQIMNHAQTAGCRAVYLLTLDAAAYFEGLEFEMVERSEAPPGIRASEEFSRLCPASAVLMRRIVNP